jgi:hypothetical protein
MSLSTASENTVSGIIHTLRTHALTRTPPSKHMSSENAIYQSTPPSETTLSKETPLKDVLLKGHNRKFRALVFFINQPYLNPWVIPSFFHQFRFGMHEILEFESCSAGCDTRRDLWRGVSEPKKINSKLIPRGNCLAGSDTPPKNHNSVRKNSAEYQTWRTFIQMGIRPGELFRRVWYWYRAEICSAECQTPTPQACSWPGRIISTSFQSLPTVAIKSNTTQGTNNPCRKSPVALFFYNSRTGISPRIPKFEHEPGLIWGRYMKKNRSLKSLATVPLK